MWGWGNGKGSGNLKVGMGFIRCRCARSGRRLESGDLTVRGSR